MSCVKFHIVASGVSKTCEVVILEEYTVRNRKQVFLVLEGTAACNNPKMLHMEAEYKAKERKISFAISQKESFS